VQVIAESIATHAPLFTIIILPSFKVINPSFNAAWLPAVESAATEAGAGATAVVSVVDGLEPLLHAKVNPAIDATNNSFFMVCSFLF
jgi:hypothetical protein